MAIVSVDTPRAMRCGTSPPPAHNYHTPAQAGFDIGTDPSPNTLQPTNSLARFVLGETTLRQTTSPTAKPRHPRLPQNHTAHTSAKTAPDTKCQKSPWQSWLRTSVVPRHVVRMSPCNPSATLASGIKPGYRESEHWIVMGMASGVAPLGRRTPTDDAQ